MKSAGKARNNGLYRHIRTSKEIIRNLLNDFIKNSYSSTYTFKLRMPGADRPRHYFYRFFSFNSTASPIPDSTITPTAIQIRSPVRGFLREPRETGTGGT